MKDFSERKLFELKSAGSPTICEMGALFEVVYAVEHYSRNGFYPEAHRVVDQFSQEVQSRNLKQYFPLVESLREEINELQESQQRILEATTQ